MSARPADSPRNAHHPGSGSLEVIVPEDDAAIRWSCHGYPNSLAKWHYHPQIEIHLIREGSGQFMAGDGLTPFEPGHVAMVGPNLPHNWLSDTIPGERLPNRDVLCHVRPQTIRRLFSIFPETAGLERVLRRSQQAIVLSGEAAAAAGELLVSMGEHIPARRVADLISLLSIFDQASAEESRTVVTPDYNPDTAVGAETAINSAIAYISSNLDDASLEQAARAASMSTSTFSRFFKTVAGIGFSDFVCRLRIGRACRLLTTTTMPIARIQRLSGYANASNFNRRFLAETGMTPSRYRKTHSGR
ncbi:helix-turn-helix domain-containing protein [Bifidobacterium callimiconis]|uniref:AraC family transcriptional regulator n=1 Tax=Bifidobacterium callimiconis TaxID=2306973 RepID=A0A430FEC9_9BIFI|nr:AraC family transcriptional regulator [Bifidobacterium callimiconis]MBT1177247.1 AraC family transcriptional regulator [Bifidobacterium callimiconis]RSX51203.1 AraC family transcriptional regulator [Bifidobacterium callimiconis]